MNITDPIRQRRASNPTLKPSSGRAEDPFPFENSTA